MLTDLGKRGTHRVDVFCPGFPADCLETLEEMADEGKETFIHAGGKLFHYIPALNDSPEWINALTSITLDELGNWLGSTIDEKALVNQKDASKTLGAPR